MPDEAPAAHLDALRAILVTAHELATKLAGDPFVERILHWTGISFRSPDDAATSVIPFKSGERARIEANGFTIIANIGDQDSDLAGGHALHTCKLPNPMYFIP